MGILRQIALAVLVISFVIFVALFGRLPALRSTPISFLYRCIWHHTPRIVRSTDNALTGGRITSSLTRFVHYLVYEPHPIVLILFLALLTSASAIFLYLSWPRLSPFPHHFLIPILLPLPYLFTYLSARSRTSYITPDNHAAYLACYPFDNTLYYPNNPCRTCLFSKPARSKHCSICRACVARADHHCVWVNNCLGADNYRWFIALLTSLGVVLSYGAGLAYLLLRESSVFTAGAWWGAARDVRGGGVWAYLIVAWEAWTHALQLDLGVGTVGLLAGLTAPLAWTMLIYHLYLMWAGMTTNETAKWADLRECVEDGLVWRRVRRGGTVGGDYTAAQKQELNGTIGYDAAAWPVQSDQVLLVTEEPSDWLSPQLAGGDTWEKCWAFGDLDNLYDLGLWHNIKDALLLR